jgi:hypothetical protein
MDSSSLPFGCKVIEKSDMTVLTLRPNLFILTIILSISVSIFLISLLTVYLGIAEKLSTAVCCLSVILSTLVLFVFCGYYALGAVKIIITSGELRIKKRFPIFKSNYSFEIADLTKAKMLINPGITHYASHQGYQITSYELSLMGNFMKYNCKNEKKFLLFSSPNKTLSIFVEKYINAKLQKYRNTCDLISKLQ